MLSALFPGSPLRASIIITEIMYNPAGTDVPLESFAQEWVEIYNIGDQTIDLTGWKMRDEDYNAENWGALTGSLAPGQVGVITTSTEAAFKASWSTAAHATIFTVSGWGVLANIAPFPYNEYLMLLNADEQVIDVVDYLTVAPWPTGVDGASIYLLPNRMHATANDNGANWAISAIGLHGALSPVSGPEPYDLASIGSPGIVVAGDPDYDPVNINLIFDAAAGSVIADPNKELYHHEDVVMLTATPAAGYRFVGWNGDVSGTANPMTITMAGLTTVEVEFQFIDDLLLTREAGHGVIAVEPALEQYAYGQEITLTATPEAGYRFVGWGGAASGQETTVILTITDNIRVTAAFLSATPTHIVMASPPRSITAGVLLSADELEAPITIGYGLDQYRPDEPFPASAGATTLIPGEALTATDIVRGPGIEPFGITMGFSSNMWGSAAEGSPGLPGTRENAFFSGHYYEFSIGVQPGYVAHLATLDTNLRRSTFAEDASGMRLGYHEWHYSRDGGTTWSLLHAGHFPSGQGTGAGMAMPTVDLAGEAGLQGVAGGATVTLRLYAWGGNPTMVNTFGFGRAQDLPYDGSIIVNPANPGGGPLLTGLVVRQPTIITVELRDALGEPAASNGGHLLALASEPAGVTFIDPQDGTAITTVFIADGKSGASFQATSTVAGEYILRATHAGLVHAAQAIVVMPAGISVADTGTILGGDNLILPADGGTATTITLQLRDAYGNDIAEAGVGVTFNSTLGNLEAARTVTDANGVARTTLTSTIAGMATVTATVDDDRNAQTEQAAVAAGSPLTVAFLFTVNQITPSNGTVTMDPEAADFIQGATVVITAVPAPGYRFVGWAGTLAGNTNPLTLTITRDETVAATFEPVPFVTRILPGGYISATSLTVTLRVAPEPHVTAYAIEESYPPGWTLKSASVAGEDDPVTGTVRFGPFFANTLRMISYELEVPPRTTGDACFHGVASANGVSSNIIGDQFLAKISIYPAGIHPADIQPSDWMLTVDEITMYAAHWKRGQSWDIEPSPILIDYVTRAGYLWRAGELYTRNPAILHPPEWWVPYVTGPHAIGHVRKLAAHASVPTRAERVLYPQWVEIRVHPSHEATVYAVEERIAANLAVGDLSGDGEADLVRGKLKWGPYFDNARRVFRYAIDYIPPAASFDGVVSVDGVSQDIGGDLFHDPDATIFDDGSGHPAAFDSWALSSLGWVYSHATGFLYAFDLGTWLYLYGASPAGYFIYSYGDDAWYWVDESLEGWRYRINEPNGWLE